MIELAVGATALLAGYFFGRLRHHGTARPHEDPAGDRQEQS